ncbi:DUF2197 domain-containing protein [Calderihabitans maritimus]|uniref:Acetyltransferase n=1 Tax=Calderihabitans maritimus TaxID=1246530 RepID=A0A1Z5HQ31_9FIRM|nr:DUF2197 domain-containing protein [Calderihabitans maritimus]GAW91405.1 acetyltransferase [Calderihabitans maritimus]
MEVKCSLCGHKDEITKVHKDYQRIAKNPTATFICERCSTRLQVQAQEWQKPKKPM